MIKNEFLLNRMKDFIINKSKVYGENLQVGLGAIAKGILGSEPIEMISFSVEIDADLNYSTRWHGTDIQIAVHIKYDAETCIAEPDDIDVTIWYNIPTTEDEDEAHNTDIIYGEYKGGPGTNYFIFRIPMDIVGLHSGQKLTLEGIRALQLGQIARRASDALGFVCSKETFLGEGTETFFDEYVANPMAMNKTLRITIPIAAGCCNRSYVKRRIQVKQFQKPLVHDPFFHLLFNIIFFRERRNR